MITQEEKKRYSRHILLSEIGYEGQLKLKNSKVLVVGAGGLGCPVLQYLVAAGVGHIGIVDFDIVDESNLQRQILFNQSHIGINKAIVAKNQLEIINPFVEIIAFPFKLNKNNVIALFEKYDLIVDGTDNFSSRYLINDAAILAKRPIVYGSIYRYEGQVTVFNYQGGPCYRCLFPNSLQQNGTKNCSATGVLAVLPGIIGTYQANEVLKIILGFGEVLSGKLLLVNSQNNSSAIMNLEPNKEQIERVRSKGLQLSYDEITCDKTKAVNSLSKEQFHQLLTSSKSIQLIDVRERHEQPKAGRLEVHSIPLRELNERHEAICRDKTVILFCKSGVRSKNAILQLQRLWGFTNLYNLDGGVDALLEYESQLITTNTEIV